MLNGTAARWVAGDGRKIETAGRLRYRAHGAIADDRRRSGGGPGRVDHDPRSRRLNRKAIVVAERTRDNITFSAVQDRRARETGATLRW
jgi:hypothetical protein